MALTTTTLASACSATDTLLKITSTASGFPAVGVYSSRQVMQIDGEYMLIDYVPVAGTVKVAMRGYNNSIAVPHDVLANVKTSAANADFAATPSGADSSRPPYLDDLLSIGEDLAFTAQGSTPVAGTSLPIPTKNTTYYINKGSAAAITLISATGAAAGLRLTFINAVAAANTITYTPGFLGDTTSSDVATSASKVGATFVIEAGPTGLWAPVNTGTGTGWTLG